MLGAFGYNVTNPYKFDGDSLYDALETVSNTLEDAWWSYDFSVYPFRLNITRKSAEVGTVLRPSRNVTAITKNIDRSGMYTRFYPTGKDDLTLPEKYVERNVNLYGIVSKVETDATMDTAEELRAWANERLKKHAEPTVTIDVDGLELAEATGQPLDKLQLGQKCLIPMSEFGAEILETITQLSYSDKIRQKEVVKVTLANNRTDVTRIISDAIKSNKKGTRVSTKTNKEDHAWFEDTNNHVAMCAEGIVGVDAQGNPNWTRLSQIIVDENGIHNTVQSVQNGLVIANTAIEQNENAIALEAQRRTEENAQLSGRITVEAGKISQVVQAVGKDGEVTAASIVLAINEAGDSEARIDANKVYIGNRKSTTVINGKLNASDVTATYIASVLANSSVVSTAYMYTTSFEIGSGAITINGYDCDLEDSIKALQITQEGNTYTLQKKHFYSLDWETVGTFSRATSLSGAWSGNVTAGKSYKVTASPQGETCYSPAVNGLTRRNDKTWASDKKSFTQTMYAYDDNGTDLYEENLSFDTTESYNEGYRVINSQVSGSYAGMVPQSAGSSAVSGRRSLGVTTRPTQASYLLINVSVHGYSIPCYFTLN